MLKIWGRLSSINVRKVVWAAGEAGITFERTDAGAAFGLVDQAWYAAMNPNRLVPVIDDDGFVLWESNVIVRYLCAKYAPGRLYPLDLAARFDAERWMDWQQTTLNPAGRNAFMQMIRTPAAQRDLALIERSRAQTEPLLALLNAHLAGHRFMAGEDFTMTDVPLGCEVHRWFGLSLERPKLPNLERWYAEVSTRPAAAATLTLPLT
jgi:glutathione S-transferase